MEKSIKKMPRGISNTNPSNIRKSKDKFQFEVRPSADPDFKQFYTMYYGYRAMFVILRNYNQIHGLGTIRGMISRWAPTNENDTAAYVDTVSAKSGIPADDPVDTGNRE